MTAKKRIGITFFSSKKQFFLKKKQTSSLEDNCVVFFCKDDETEKWFISFVKYYSFTRKIPIPILKKYHFKIGIGIIFSNYKELKDFISFFLESHNHEHDNAFFDKLFDSRFRTKSYIVDEFFFKKIKFIGLVLKGFFISNFHFSKYLYINEKKNYELIPCQIKYFNLFFWLIFTKLRKDLANKVIFNLFKLNMLVRYRMFLQQNGNYY